MARLELQACIRDIIIISSYNMPIPFRPIARLLTRTLRPAPKVDLTAAQDLLQQMEQGSAEHGVLITVNHYFAPDFHAWWFVILISAIFPLDIHWVVTSGKIALMRMTNHQA